MRIYIPVGSDDPIDYPGDLEDLLDGLRLSELESLDDMLEPDQMKDLLAGVVGVKIVRPVMWVFLLRTHPDLEIDGFDVEIIPEGEKPAPPKD